MTDIKKFRAQMREAVANYLGSEGCECCQGQYHKDNKEALAKLLNVPKYSDGSGYDFGKYRKKKDKP